MATTTFDKTELVRVGRHIKCPPPKWIERFTNLLWNSQAHSIAGKTSTTGELRPYPILRHQQMLKIVNIDPTDRQCTIKVHNTYKTANKLLVKRRNLRFCGEEKTLSKKHGCTVLKLSCTHNECMIACHWWSIIDHQIYKQQNIVSAQLIGICAHWKSIAQTFFSLYTMGYRLNPIMREHNKPCGVCLQRYQLSSKEWTLLTQLHPLLEVCLFIFVICHPPMC